MITQAYTFRNLPKWIRENENGKRDKFCNGVEKDIEAELGNALPTAWSMDVTGCDLHLIVQVRETDARFLECALHNLHSAKLLS